MNEQKNTELIETLYAAFSRGDVQTILDGVTSDTVWTTEGPATVPYTGERHGPEGVLGFFQGLGGTLDNMRLTTSHFVAQGNAVMTLGRFAGTVKATGKSRRQGLPVRRYYGIGQRGGGLHGVGRGRALTAP
jgi:ketosteroid isomerase-like protein